MLKKWQIENEAKIRQDAINRSYSVNLGKITEHLLPYHESFLSQFNPKDARFIGSPIDLIVFDGYADKKDDIMVYLIEIKTGNSKLSETQKKIKNSVLSGNIRWAEINPKDYEPKTEEKKDGKFDSFLQIVVSISEINNITDYSKFADLIAEHLKKATRLTINDDWDFEDAIEQEVIGKLNLTFNHKEEKQQFIEILKNLIL